MDTVKVVCGVIFQNDKVFICRRKQGKALGGLWEFPGGKVEEGEEYRESLVRELDEELGMQVDVRDHFKTVVHAYEKLTIELIAFACAFRTATLNMTDHDAYEWVNPSELVNWNLAPADIPIAQQIYEDGQRGE